MHSACILKVEPRYPHEKGDKIKESSSVWPVTGKMGQSEVTVVGQRQWDTYFL